MVLPAKPFLMIRHGESEANVRQVFSGQVDCALTDLGREQAHAAGKIIAALPDRHKPRRIIHSHLSRARDTAAIINEYLGGLQMSETPDLAEQNFGDWEGQNWEVVRPLLRSGQDPQNGETHEIFYNRVKRALKDVLLDAETLPLIVCHGGFFRAFAMIHNQEFTPVGNCAAYRFTPRDHAYPWEIACLTESA